MNDGDKTYSIIRRRAGGEPQTVQTGLSEPDARAWLEQQASKSGGSVSPDLVVADSRGDVWTAALAE